MRVPRLPSPLLAALAAALLVLAPAVGGCGSSSAGPSETGGFQGSEVVPPAPARPLPLKDVSGRPFDLSALKGKAVVVAFLFANCPDICPLTAEKFRQAIAKLGPGASDLRLVAVSVDPEGDTPAAVRRFLRTHGLTGKMTWLAGTRAQLEAVWKAWGIAVKPTPDTEALIVHSGTTFGLDGSGRIRVLYSSQFTGAELAHDVPLLAAPAQE